MLTTLKTLDDQLNALILSGRFLEALEQFYADDTAMQENAAPATVGKAENRVREEKFWGAVVETFHGVQQLSQAVGDGVTTSEWRYDWTIGGARSQLQEVAVRRWRDGKVVAERFYYQA